MTKISVFILLLALFSFASTAQVISTGEMNDLLNSREIQIDNPIINNFLMIRQIDDNNEIISRQNNPGALQNNVLVNQHGTGNKGYIGQNGSELETHLWQYNSSNEANLWSEGDNILTQVKQDGVGNIINSYIENTGLVLRSASLYQNGNQNQINLSLRGDGFNDNSTEQSMVVSQVGNGHVVNAHMEPFSESLQIDQTPGTYGEGMTVDVSTSAFTFPMKN